MTLADYHAARAQGAAMQTDVNSVRTSHAVRTAAYSQHAKYPQYAGHWDGPEWHLVEFVKPVKTKGGLRFDRGDVTLLRVEEMSAIDREVSGRTHSHVAYSIRGGIDCAVPARSYRTLA